MHGNTGNIIFSSAYTAISSGAVLLSALNGLVFKHWRRKFSTNYKKYLGQTYKNFGSLLCPSFDKATETIHPWHKCMNYLLKKPFWHFVLYMSMSSFHSNQSPILYSRFRIIIIMAWYWNKQNYLILDLIKTSQHVSKFVTVGCLCSLHEVFSSIVHVVLHDV